MKSLAIALLVLLSVSSLAGENASNPTVGRAHQTTPKTTEPAPKSHEVVLAGAVAEKELLSIFLDDSLGSKIPDPPKKNAK